MNQIQLSPSLKAALELRHAKVRDRNECDRIKAILLRSEGWKILTIAQALRIHESTITRHINDFSTQQKLAPENGGSSSFLNEQQTEALITHLSAVTYFNMSDIREHIKDTFDITYSIPGLQKWLHRNGFSYKQPKGVPHKYSQEKQDIFVEEYNELKAAVASGEPLLSMDAMPREQSLK